ncbi:hypothetical protein HY947_05045 [Candidatus Gottesmanbacteria bacterium]|nr:hypothetical protein [Candidatus Gottesmanbacteria bacterium]
MKEIPKKFDPMIILWSLVGIVLTGIMFSFAIAITPKLPDGVLLNNATKIVKNSLEADCNEALKPKPWYCTGINTLAVTNANDQYLSGKGTITDGTQFTFLSRIVNDSALDLALWKTAYPDCHDIEPFTFDASGSIANECMAYDTLIWREGFLPREKLSEYTNNDQNIAFSYPKESSISFQGKGVDTEFSIKFKGTKEIGFDIVKSDNPCQSPLTSKVLMAGSPVTLTTRYTGTDTRYVSSVCLHKNGQNYTFDILSDSKNDENDNENILRQIALSFHFLSEKNQEKTQIPNISPTETPVPIKNFTIDTYTQSLYSRGGITLDTPWALSECPGMGVSFCSQTSPDNSYEIITIDRSPVSYDASSFRILRPSVDIGIINDNPKEETLTLPFRVRSVMMELMYNNKNAASQGVHIESATDVLQHIAESIHLVDTVSTCKNPSLIPLADFPQSFSLANLRQSETNEPVVSYYPFTKKNTGEISYQPQNSNRQYIISYIRDGNSFASSNEFDSTLSPITTTDEANTELWHVNCIDTQDDGPGNEQAFVINHDNANPFAVDLYGKGDNGTKLWSKEKWTVDLLKNTRDVVYVRRSKVWQKYKAVEYAVTEQAMYGGKPAIYLYPKYTMPVNVTIHPQGIVFNTDELYNPDIFGWKIIAKPNGTITQENETRDSLYYEAMIKPKIPDRGYIVSQSHLMKSLSDYSLRLGLSQNENQAFLAFWKPKIPSAPFYQLSHLSRKEINSLYPLSMSPEPDTLIRVEIYIKPLAQYSHIEPPIFEQVPLRHGFAAVEWGGILDTR